MTPSTLLLFSALMVVLFPLCLCWHEYLHTVLARVRGWPFATVFTPLGPLQGSRTFAVSWVKFPSDASRLDLFLFSAAPRLFDLVALPSLAGLQLLALPFPIRVVTLALMGCWTIDFVFETFLIAVDESPANDAWSTYRVIENWIGFNLYLLLSLVGILGTLSLTTWTFWKAL